MTEAEWLTCYDSQKLLTFLKDKASGRKLRLSGCACCRAIWHQLSSRLLREGVDLAERFTDGLASEGEWADTYYELIEYRDGLDECRVAERISVGAVLGTMIDYLRPDKHRIIALGVYNACRVAARVFDESTGEFNDSDDLRRRMAVESAKQAGLLRDIFGNPFRSVAIDPAWLTSDVLALARGIYGEKAFDRMPILADALQDAGCNNDDVLNHCRDGSAPHVRGCWALDLVLGKE